jgi:hypothetical protein
VDATGDDDDDDDGPLVEDSDAPVEDSDADGESEDGEDDGPPVPSKTKNRPKTVVRVNRPVVVSVERSRVDPQQPVSGCSYACC